MGNFTAKLTCCERDTLYEDDLVQMKKARQTLQSRKNKMIESLELDLAYAQENSNNFLRSHELKMALLRDDTSDESTNESQDYE